MVECVRLRLLMGGAQRMDRVLTRACSVLRDEEASQGDDDVDVDEEEKRREEWRVFVRVSVECVECGKWEMGMMHTGGVRGGVLMDG